MQMNMKSVCRGAVLFSLIGTIFILGCSKKTGNPLLDATEGQFIQAMDFNHAKFFGSDCENIFFNPSAVSNPRPNDRESCEKTVRKNAASAGIPNIVTLAHLEDSRIKERYFKLKK